ncbi:alpha-galactosidase [Plantibacter sp. MCCC 1A11337]|uniref:alpha-galactosidase n=1 Tax=Plantibacter sp. MCCC 1A11337 TaxID=2736644 RepID=UPI0015836D10|nr:alpha-galactosidase [Plantibacter sp. MCCC 1A11337]NUJ86693.1 alpha-galactosidase [Plantibacter sp. MCCC 1A11337]
MSDRSATLEHRVVHLQCDGVSVVLVQHGTRLPTIAHWGAAVDADDLEWLAAATAAVRGDLVDGSDAPYEPSLLPEHASGWSGLPGLRAHRAGTAWSSRFDVVSVEVDRAAFPAGEVRQCGAALVEVTAVDDQTGIALLVAIELTPSGLLRTRVMVTNRGDDLLEIEGVVPALPIPTSAREILDFAGRWGNEKLPQRLPVTTGTHLRESRHGRPGLDATGVTAIGTPGFDSRAGDVWLCHVGWSGNHTIGVERTDGHLAFRGGELLLPGEVRLGPGEDHRTPWVYGAYGVGLDAASSRYHRWLRSTSRAARRPRPVTLNVWEAVLFDHDLEVLTELATRAAAIGVERYVLDDGWFRGRHDDTRGLGDWTPDPERWPDGLAPLADRVRSLGMEFGLWFEPEMINEDSDLAREHPDWILRARDELPSPVRHQQVLDLGNPAAFDHILQAIDTLVGELGIAYLKWDHNRDLVDAGHPSTGRAAVHDQTEALYRLLDELRSRHPHLEIESCASGGGRVDLGVLERSDRVHTSDNHDPIERARMLRWTGLLVPPEMLGSHVASARSATTGRTHTLPTRCAVALLGHFGVEWDLRELDDADRTTLARWITVFTRHRGLIATGRVVGDGEWDDDAPTLRGVVAEDGTTALYTLVTPPRSADSRRRVRLPGLRPDGHYRLAVAQDDSLGPRWVIPQWLRDAPPLDADPATLAAAPVLSGGQLAVIGLDLPTFQPDRAITILVTAV